MPSLMLPSDHKITSFFTVDYVVSSLHPSCHHYPAITFVNYIPDCLYPVSWTNKSDGGQTVRAAETQQVNNIVKAGHISVG